MTCTCIGNACVQVYVYMHSSDLEQSCKAGLQRFIISVSLCIQNGEIKEALDNLLSLEKQCRLVCSAVVMVV